MISGTLYDMRPNQTVENIAIVAANDVIVDGLGVWTGLQSLNEEAVQFVSEQTSRVLLDSDNLVYRHKISSQLFFLRSSSTIVVNAGPAHAS